MESLLLGEAGIDMGGGRICCGPDAYEVHELIRLKDDADELLEASSTPTICPPLPFPPSPTLGDGSNSRYLLALSSSWQHCGCAGDGAESRNCPTDMFTLLGSRALLTIPQIPRAPKDRATVTSGNSIVFRTGPLPDHSGTLF
jgi:hypothetical protein